MVAVPTGYKVVIPTCTRDAWHLLYSALGQLRALVLWCNKCHTSLVSGSLVHSCDLQFCAVIVSVAFDGTTREFCTYLYNIARAVKLCTEMIHTCSVELLNCVLQLCATLTVTNALNIL